MKRNAITLLAGGLFVFTLLSCGGSGSPSATFLPSNYTFTAIDPTKADFNVGRNGSTLQNTADTSNLLVASSFSNFLAGITSGITLPPGAAHVHKASINSNGAFLVNCNDAGLTSTFPAIYSSANATAVLPPMPAGVTQLAGTSMNPSQQFVATEDVNATHNVFYYDSPTATPVLLGPYYGSPYNPRISPSGAIMMVQPSGAQVVYPTAASTPITFSNNLTDWNIVRFTVDNRLVGAYKNGSVMQAAYLSPANYATPILLPVPAGTTESYVMDITAQGVGVGFYVDSGNVFHGCIWPSLTGQPINFTSAGSDSLGALSVDRLDYVMNDGTILGYHYDNSQGTYFIITPKH